MQKDKVNHDLLLKELLSIVLPRHTVGESSLHLMADQRGTWVKAADCQPPWEVRG